MIEQVFKLASGNEKTIEKVLFDENIHYIHMIISQNEGFPEHYSNANIYMTVIRGTLSLTLGDQGIHEYDAGTLLKFPNNTKMQGQNLHTETLELIIVKAPAPKV